MASEVLKLQLKLKNSSGEEEAGKFYPSGSLEFPNIENQNFYASSQEMSIKEECIQNQFDYEEGSQQEEQLPQQYENKNFLNLDNIIEYQEFEVYQSPVTSERNLISQFQQKHQEKKQAKYDKQLVQNETNQKNDLKQDLGINIAEAESLNVPQPTNYKQQTPQFTKAVPVPPTSKLKGKKFEFPSAGELSQKAKNFSKALDNRKENQPQMQIPQKKQSEQESEQKRKVLLDPISDEELQTNQTISVYSDQPSENSGKRSANLSQQLNSDRNPQYSFENLLEKFNRTDLTPSYGLPYNHTSTVNTQQTSDLQDTSNSNTRSIHDKIEELTTELTELKDHNEKLRLKLEEQEQYEIIKTQDNYQNDDQQLEEFKTQTKKLQQVLKEKQQKINFVKSQQKASTKELQNLYYDLWTVKEIVEEMVPTQNINTLDAKCVKNEITQKIYQSIWILKNNSISKQSKWNQLESEKQQLQNELISVKETIKKQASEHIDLIVQLNAKIEEKEKQIETLQEKNVNLLQKASTNNKKEESGNAKHHFQSTQSNQQGKSYSPNQSQSQNPSLMSTIEVTSMRANSPFNQLQKNHQQVQKARIQVLQDLEQKTKSLTSTMQNLQTTKSKDTPSTQNFQEISPNTTRVKKVVSVSPGSVRCPIPKFSDQHKRQASSDMNQEMLKSVIKEDEEKQMEEAKKLYPHTYKLSPRLARELAVEDMRRKCSQY